MLIYLTISQYRKATGCTLRTLYKRADAGYLIRLDSEHLLYDTNTKVNAGHKQYQCRANVIPDLGALEDAGIEFSVVVDYKTAVNLIEMNKTAGLLHGQSGARVGLERGKQDGIAPSTLPSTLPSFMPGLLEALRGVKEVAYVPRLTGDIKLHRRMLGNHIMSAPPLPWVFMELLLLASPKGIASLTALPDSARSMGINAYAQALQDLAREGIVSLELEQGIAQVKVLKWSVYQPDGGIEGVVVRDLSHPEVEILPDNNLPSDSPLNIYITNPLSSDKKEKEINKESEGGEVKTDVEQVDQLPATRRRKKGYRKIKEIADPYRLDQYDPKYRPFVPDAHEIYEYYRDKTGAPSSRSKTIDKIIPLLLHYAKNDLLTCVDNYVAMCAKTNKLGTNYIKFGQNFFDEFYSAYLPGELPVISPQAPPERKKRRAPNPEVQVIKIATEPEPSEDK